MINLTPSMRLKVKRDTFYLPDPNRGVYFRNNSSSFSMEGSTIVQWIEKLMPMFNGEYTLANLTEGLPAPYRDRVYEIAEVLYINGFVRDVSQDRPHQLTDQILNKHASQIEFLDSFGDSGAFRFQAYRQVKVLAVGSGPFFVSLVSSLLESGLPKFHTFITDLVPTNRRRLRELVAHAHKTDHEVAVEEVMVQKERVSSWNEIVKPFDSILYVSQEGDIEELRELHTVCRQENKLFLPAICFHQSGLAGPLVHSESKGCWESAWRRIHQTVLGKDQQLPVFSSTAGAMLANLIVFELFKETTRVTESEQNNRFFLLDLETLEGQWHSFMPHPLVTGHGKAQWVEDFDLAIENKSNRVEPKGLFLALGHLTSEKSGILHVWEEGDLKQLPLAQCRVQAVDPLSEGPAELLPETVCAGLTHEEARKEAGLTGIEAYVSQTADLLIKTLPSNPKVESSLLEIQGFVGIGAGETVAEGVCRGLQRYLDEEFRKQQVNQKIIVHRMLLGAVEDEHCRYYMQALTTMQGSPMIGLGREVSGFPVVWVGTSCGWFGCVGLNKTVAMRNALQKAIMKVQNQGAFLPAQGLEASTVLQEEPVQVNLAIPSEKDSTQPEILESALKVLERNRIQLLVFELELEPFLKEELAGVFGVLLREEETR
ncbi:putative thiazole-containing bacteriocin maturation protein [Peribacillus glennii]|uniref:Putative thiazole-containing bacteriocin maturation protein n=1 Tax=Peribacillus glennii TaxID=2303991 RepID=A0A372LFZ4_9BACI|nr:putative thiazole-containing bacteriocin maturation protein [Peribacillus glennii]RFU65215.1 putative thiazole-containing bacteriocin maturation protein [Peribacillus glennii]